MPKLRKDEINDVYYFDETEEEKDVKFLKAALAELQEREVARDPKWKPKYDLMKLPK